MDQFIVHVKPNMREMLLHASLLLEGACPPRPTSSTNVCAHAVPTRVMAARRLTPKPVLGFSGTNFTRTHMDTEDQQPNTDELCMLAEPQLLHYMLEDLHAKLVLITPGAVRLRQSQPKR